MVGEAASMVASKGSLLPAVGVAYKRDIDNVRESPALGCDPPADAPGGARYLQRLLCADTSCGRRVRRQLLFPAVLPHEEMLPNW